MVAPKSRFGGFAREGRMGARAPKATVKIKAHVDLDGLVGQDHWLAQGNHWADVWAKKGARLHDMPTEAQEGAWKDMSEVLKQIVKLLLSLWPLWGCLPKGLERTSAGPAAKKGPRVRPQGQSESAKKWQRQAAGLGHRVAWVELRGRPAMLCKLCGAYGSVRPKGLTRPCPRVPAACGAKAIKDAKLLPRPPERPK